MFIVSVQCPQNPLRPALPALLRACSGCADQLPHPEGEDAKLSPVLRDRWKGSDCCTSALSPTGATTSFKWLSALELELRARNIALPETIDSS